MTQPALLTVPQASQVALLGTPLSASADLAMRKILAAATGRPPLSPMGTGASSPSMVAQPSALQKSSCASLPAAAVILAAYPAAAKQVPQATESPTVMPRLAASLAVAYYVDSPSDEEAGAAVDAQIDFSLGDLE